MSPEELEGRAAFQKAEAERHARDWPNRCRYREKNAAVLSGAHRPRVVFLGDSITENWQWADPRFFDAATVDRGISGQTSAQMVLRFYPDVVALRPRVVHIMAGTNDVAGNTGPVSNEAVLDNLRVIVDVAQANGIKVVLASIPPAKGFPWQPELRPAARIAELNRRLRQIAAERHIVYVDYYGPLDDGQGGLRAGLANDGVHPNRDGYALMRPLAERAIAQADQ